MPVAVRSSEYENVILLLSNGVIFVYLFNNISPLSSLLEWLKFCIFTGLLVSSIVLSSVCFSGEKQTALVALSFPWIVQLKYLRLLELAVLIGETE